MPIFNYLAVFRRIHKKRVHLAVIILMPISRGWAQNPYKHLHTGTQQRRLSFVRQYENSVLCLCMKLSEGVGLISTTPVRSTAAIAFLLCPQLLNFF